MLKNATKFFITTAFGLGIMLYGASAKAGFLEDNNVSLGIQGSFFTGGFSAKLPLNETFTLQGVAALSSNLSNFSVRGLYTLSETSDATVYALGSVGILTFRGNRFFSSETAIGAGIGLGVDYDLRNAFPDLPPLFLSGEIGANFVSFDNFTGVNLFGLGLGIHYRF